MYSFVQLQLLYDSSCVTSFEKVPVTFFIFGLHHFRDDSVVMTSHVRTDSVGSDSPPPAVSYIQCMGDEWSICNSIKMSILRTFSARSNEINIYFEVLVCYFPVLASCFCHSLRCFDVLWHDCFHFQGHVWNYYLLCAIVFPER